MAVSPASKAVVLVVEDDHDVRVLAVEMASDAGFEVLEAENADDAIRVLETRLDVRIIFTDIDMPGSMDGLKLAAFVRGRWPPIEIIVTSGHHRVSEDDLPERGVFLPKPYTRERVVAELLRFAA